MLAASQQAPLASGLGRHTELPGRFLNAMKAQPSYQWSSRSAWMTARHHQPAGLADDSGITFQWLPSALIGLDPASGGARFGVALAGVVRADDAAVRSRRPCTLHLDGGPLGGQPEWRQ